MTRKAIQDQWLEWGNVCWGCGKNNTHGLQLKSYWEGDETIAHWEPKPYHLAFPGVLCGGIIASLIDCHATNTANAAAYKAEGRELNSKADKGYVTGSLSIKYIKPTPVDQPVTLRARVKEIKRRKIIVTCSLFSEGIETATGEVVAIRLHETSTNPE
ncbi:PaaI family thioesterase [Candidatus Bathyarchaeota archaeon]|nr:PaaI family thioesterase [Candidatus Bathyarchaeota archaeon]